MSQCSIRILAGLAVTAALAVMAPGCSPQRTAASVINDKVYAVTPDAVKVTAGIISGEIAQMKITERLVQGSGDVATPAKLTGRLTLKNVSTDQAVRLIRGRILYIDAQGQPIKLETNRSEPTFRVASAAPVDGLDPGQDTSQMLDAEFPAEALKRMRLKEIRLELSYIASPFKEQALNFTVSIGGQ